MDLTNVPLNEYGHVQTRDGSPARLLCKDAKEPVPIVGLTECGFGDVIRRWLPDGSCPAHGPDNDLIPVPRKVRVRGWLNVYRNQPYRACELYPDRGTADQYSGASRIACIEIDREVTEGEGLTENRDD